MSPQCQSRVETLEALTQRHWRPWSAKGNIPPSSPKNTFGKIKPSGYQVFPSILLNLHYNSFISFRYHHILSIFFHSFLHEILVGGFNPSEKYYSIGMIIPNIWENMKCSKPPTSHVNLHGNHVPSIRCPRGRDLLRWQRSRSLAA